MARISSRTESLNSNLHHLPEEILIQILVRLPVKSLLRFTSVCKSWCSLMTHPTFIQAHLETTSQKNTYIILTYYPKSESNRFGRYSIRYDDESFHEYYEPQFPSHILTESLAMHGSCNGLICLSNEEGTGTVCLWNPALRKFKTLPNSLILDSKSNLFKSITNLAFGFHPGVNDYKVVRIFSSHDLYIPFKDRFLIEVYSLSTDSWRRIDDGPSCYIFPQKPAIVNGAVYWVGMRITDAGACLVRFELGDEVFEEVVLPKIAPKSQLYIAVLEESLCLFQFYTSSGYEWCDMWTMEGGKLGCWTKRFTVNIPDQSNIILLGLRKNGELLQTDSLQGFLMGDRLLSYNFETQRAKDLGIDGYFGTYSAYSYVESIIQLDGAESLFPLDNGNSSCELASRKKKKEKEKRK